MSSHPPPRVKHKYVPASQRPRVALDQYALSAHPHLTPEAEAHLFTVDDLIASARGNLSDSMWAKTSSQSKAVSRSSAARQPTKLSPLNESEPTPIKADTLSPSHYITQISSSLSDQRQQGKMSAPPHFRGPAADAQPHVAPHLYSQATASGGQQAVLPHLRGPSPAMQSRVAPHLRGQASATQQSPSPHPHDSQSVSEQVDAPYLRALGLADQQPAPIATTQRASHIASLPAAAADVSGAGTGMVPWNGPGFKAPSPAQVGRMTASAATASQSYMQIPSPSRPADLGPQSNGPVLSGDERFQRRTLASKIMAAKQGPAPVNQTNGATEGLNEDSAQPIVVESMVETARPQPIEQSPAAAPTVEDSFIAFMNNKKGPIITVPHAQKPIARPNPNGDHPFVNPKWALTEDTTGNFGTYIQVKKEAPVTNGKTYTFNGPASVISVMPEKREGTHVWVDTVTPAEGPISSIPAEKENVNNFNQKDPHAVSPQKYAGVTVDKVCKSAPTVDKEKVVSETVGPWVNGLSDLNVLEEIINTDLKAQGDIPPTKAVLTQDALVKTTGFAPRIRSNSFDDKVSDAGVPPQSKERIRATQGKSAAQEFLDWDGKTWLPPPCDWENARGTFDDSFIPDYIKEWSASLPCGPALEVDTSTKEFLFGRHPINNNELLDPIDFPDSHPDLKFCQDEQKRAHQTAAIEANNFSIRFAKRQRIIKQNEEANRERIRVMEAKEPEPNPFAPAIAMYLRPAMEKDAASIATIYNYYVNNSIIPEDQEACIPVLTFYPQQPIQWFSVPGCSLNIRVLQESDALVIIQGAKAEKLPFIVAVRGREPPITDAQGRLGVKKPILPQFETIVGFAFTEIYNFGFSGSRNGRSRATANLQLYVHNDYEHKGVGRNLLDRLLHSMTPAYSFKNATSWINPKDDKTYNSENLVKWHQIFFQLPVDGKNDKNLDRVREFLAKFFFHDVAYLRAAVRKSIHPGPAKFLDLVIFQAEATHDGDFDPYA